jgi:hypothetical protein
MLRDAIDGVEMSPRDVAELERLRLWPDEMILHCCGVAAHIDDCTLIGDEWYWKDDCSICEHCGDSAIDDDMRTVYVASRRGEIEESWCESCRECSAYYWESDDEYHSEPEPEPEPDDDDDNSDAYGISGYHDHDVSPSRPKSLADDVIGVEMETYWTYADDIGNYMSREGLTPDNGWKAERDGSLDSTHGVEIVSRPIPYAELIHAHDDNQWYSIFQFARGKSRAWDMGKGYGLHLSINRARMSQLHAIKFSRFINGNPELCSAIAGRKQTDYAAYRKNELKSAERLIGSKYLACAMRSESRIEVRIFRASWNWERFVRNVQFVESIRRYTRDCSLSDVALCDSSYLRWISRQSAGEFRTLRAWFKSHGMTSHESALALAERPALAE